MEEEKKEQPKEAPTESPSPGRLTTIVHHDADGDTETCNVTVTVPAPAPATQPTGMCLDQSSYRVVAGGLVKIFDDGIISIA